MDILEPTRINKVLPWVRGRLLDVGCGYNNLVRKYGRGVGADVYPWPGADVLIGSAARLPFQDQAFDTVTIVAALNHIPNREMALREVRRVLADDGRLVLTMIDQWVGLIGHVVFRQDEQVRGGGDRRERKGLSPRTVRALLHGAGFVLERRVHFELFLNAVYVARKA
jgi:SAM-dependent methyltransferase